jgi:hypothetical protein
MKPNQTLWMLITTGTALTCLGLRAFADTESFTETYGSSSAPLAVNGTDFPTVVPLPQFDTSLGNLTDIEVTLNTTGVLQAEVANVGVATVFTNAEAAGKIAITGPDGAGASVTLTAPQFSGLIGAGTPTVPTFALGPSASASTSSLSFVPSSDFAAYEGGGTLNFVLNAAFAGNFSGNGPSGLSFNGFASDYGSVEVDYTFSAVPEPGNLFLFSFLCFCGFAALDRMRRPRCSNA